MSGNPKRPISRLAFYSGPKNRYLISFNKANDDFKSGEITRQQLAQQVKEINKKQVQYMDGLAKALEKRVFMKQQAQAFQREFEKEQKRLEKERQDREAEDRIRAQVEAVRLEREAKERKRKEARKARKAQKGIPFTSIANWASNRLPEGAFMVTLKSAIANVKRDFRFKSPVHFERWIKSIENQNVISESDNYREFSEVMGTKPEIFANVIPSIQSITGGCQWNGKEEDKIETPYFTFEVYSPQTKHNNCGFKIIERILGEKLDYAEVRKKYGMKYDEPLPVDKFSLIYQEYIHGILCIIDETFCDVINKDKRYEYVFVEGDHYYLVLNAKEKIFKDKHTNRGLLCWDIETRPTEEYVMVGSQKSYILKPTILCAYYVPYKGKPQKITFITDEYDCCRLFLNWLTLEAHAGRFYHCIAHNGSRFDCYFLTAQLSKTEQLHTETQLRGHSIIGIQYKSHLFKDSCCFLTNSLDSLCKAFKVKQAKLTEFFYNGNEMTNKNICFYRPELCYEDFMDLKYDEPEFWNLYEDYCMMDCVSLYEIWTTFQNQYDSLIEKIFQYRPELLKNVRLMSSNTIGSLAKKILENSCMVKSKTGKYVYKKEYHQLIEFHSTDKKEDPEKLKFLSHASTSETNQEGKKFINQFKRGGISHTNQAGKHNHSLISYDIASQYPASMLYMLIPAGKSEWTKAYNSMRHGYYHLKNLKFETPYKFKPVARSVLGQSLEWSCESMEELYCDSFMIRYLKEKYGLVSFDVERGLVSSSYIRGESLFGDYVNTLYGEKKKQDALKKNGSAEYNQALRECIKLFLNSLSGKLVEDPSHYFQLEYAVDSTIKMNGLPVEKVQDKCKMNPWVGCGIMVYSWSKRLLFECVGCLPNNSDDVIHIETDSIYFNKKNNDEFVKNVEEYKQSGIEFYPMAIGDELGNIKVEKDTDEVSYFLGKKFYCIGDLYKIKGIPLKTIDEAGNDVYLVDQSLYEDVYQGKTVVREFYTMKKSLFGERCEISSHKMSRTVKPAMEYKEYN
jgi:hypothetical protein